MIGKGKDDMQPENGKETSRKGWENSNSKISDVPFLTYYKELFLGIGISKLEGLMCRS